MKRNNITENLKICFPTIPDIKEDISLLIQYRSNITGRYSGVIHLIPKAIASLQRVPMKEILDVIRQIGNTNNRTVRQMAFTF